MFPSVLWWLKTLYSRRGSDENRSILVSGCMKADSSLYQCFSIIDSYLESCSVDIRYAYLLIGTIYEASNNSGPTASILTKRNGGMQLISPHWY